MRTLLSALALAFVFALPAHAFDTVRSAGPFVVFEDQNGIGCWALAKRRVIEFYLSQNDETRTTSVILVYDSGKIALAHRSKAGIARGGDVNPGEVYEFPFRREQDAQDFIKALIQAVSVE